MKKSVKFAIICVLLIMSISILCGCSYWDVGFLTGLYRRRAVWMESSEIDNFADKYIISTFATVELPDNYPNLSNSYYFLLDQSKRQLTPEDFLIDGAVFVMEFNIDGEVVYGIVNLSQGFSYHPEDTVNLRVKTDCIYTLNKVKSEQIQTIDYIQILHTDDNSGDFRIASMAFEFDYKRLAFMEDYEDNSAFNDVKKAFDKNYLTATDWYLYYSTELLNSNSAGFGAITFIDERDIPDEEKISWHMQVVNDIKENSFDYLWKEYNIND